MIEIEVGDLTFSFLDRCDAGKYDDWSFYRNQFQSVAGSSKAVNMLCVDDDAAWLVEIKDYRHHPRTMPVDLGDEVAGKVRDTLAGLAAASAKANDDDERRLARRALAKRRWRVALHLEQPRATSRLWHQPFNRASVGPKLRSKRLKAVDAHPVIVSRDDPRSKKVPWTVR